MRETITQAAIDLAERGVPDVLVRAGMRRAVAGRLRAERTRSEGDRSAMLEAWHNGPIALVPDAANAQHYEVPSGFFELVLGPRLKYSSCLWESPDTDLESAEEAMLALTAERAGIQDGMRVLDLGCGWGSLSLWVAEQFPDTSVVAVSNSQSQGQLIRDYAHRRGLENVEHRVIDVNDLHLQGSFDAVVSVEMLEHIRNHPDLLDRLAAAVNPGATLFVHVFAHRKLFWEFTDRGPGDWMARYFFSGGIMPSHARIGELFAPFSVADSWWINGTHYERTLNAWLAGLDANRDSVTKALRPVYGTDTSTWIQRWRMFFMASAEFFGYGNGDVNGVSHHLVRLD
jgi:cyclopropane-fatty-acyl-phospholipid synthase